MIEFTAITNKNYGRVRSCYRRCPYGLSDYSLGMKLMWKGFFRSEAAFLCGCLIVKNRIGKRICFDYPVPEDENADIQGALDAIEEYCKNSYIPLSFYAVPKSRVGELAQRYRLCAVSSERSYDEYIYDADEMTRFQGKHYSGQRNHINKFYKLYPGARFRKLEKGDAEKIREFWKSFSYASEKEGRDAGDELKRARAIMRGDFSWGCGGCMELDGKIISLSLGEICGDTMIIHIEKALYEYEGVYPATVEGFAARFCGGVRYINREEDGGDRGLRRSKLQYRPKLMSVKYNVDVRTELSRWDRIPEIKTQRLSLTHITEEDKPMYNRLCLDDERNKYWGYDYRDDEPSPDYDYFLSVAESDFKTRTAANFAVRLEGKFIGEALIYNLDYKGGAEIGIRLLKEYDGHGYAKEAISALAEKALYSLSLECIYFKCFKENTRSQRMLSSCFEKNGEDGTYYHFIKRI